MSQEERSMGGHSIGHSKPKGVYVCVLIWMVSEKELLHTDSNTGIYYSSDKVGTIYLV
jgi:hypothetical protein